MDAEERKKITDELGAAFGGAEDVTPAEDQPLHVLLPRLRLQPPWKSPCRALLRFRNWPNERPDFWVDMDVVNGSGEPPRSPREDCVLGESWRGFSFNVPWDGSESPTLALQKWLVRFREAT